MAASRYWLLDRQSGTVAAEFALVIPAVVIVLAFCMLGLGAIARQIQAQEVAAVVARSSARGDPIPVGGAYSDVRLEISRRGKLVCATAKLVVGASVLQFPGLEAEATSCSLAN